MATSSFFGRSIGAWALAGLLLGVSASQSNSQAYSVYESINQTPAGWTKDQRAAVDENLQLKIALKPSNYEAFEQQALDIATPGHALYGKHMTREEVKQWIKPPTEATDAVMRWIQSAGITDIQDDGDWIHLNAPVEKAERLLKTDFHIYEHQATGERRIRTLGYQVPVSVQQYIDLVQPTTMFGQMRKQVQRSAKLTEVETEAAKMNPGCGTINSPACLKTLYNIGDFKPSGKNGLKFGIAGFLEEYAKYDDLEQFLSKFAPEAKGANFTFVGVNGGLNTQDGDAAQDDIEANLDIQYAVALTNPVPVTYYQTAGRPPMIPDLDQPGPKVTNEPYLDWVTYLSQLPDGELPQVISHSYGEDEQSIPANYSEAVCRSFAQLGARGASIIFSSGDTGVGSACQTNDGKNTTRFLPIFPATCPWVTSVGGTFKINPEYAVDFSSGGFSDRFARPKWQETAVSKYLTGLGETWKGLYNPEGRGFPDVSAQAFQYSVIDKGGVTLVGGTRYVEF
jgi:tripeptidyl-peptidase-1